MVSINASISVIENIRKGVKEKKHPEPVILIYTSNSFSDCPKNKHAGTVYSCSMILARTICGKNNELLSYRTGTRQRIISYHLFTMIFVLYIYID